MSSVTISFQDFLKVDIRTGTVVSMDEFPQAKKPAYKLRIDFGEQMGIKRNSAQLTKLYEKNEIQGRQVVAVVNFTPKQVANFLSEALVLGVPGKNGDVVLLQPERRVPNGSRVF